MKVLGALIWTRKFLLASLVVGWWNMGSQGIVLLACGCGGALLDGLGVKGLLPDPVTRRYKAYVLTFVWSIAAVPLLLLCHNTIIQFFHDAPAVRAWIDIVSPFSHAVAVRIPAAVQSAAILKAAGYGGRVEHLLYLYAVNGGVHALYATYILANICIPIIGISLIDLHINGAREEFKKRTGRNFPSITAFIVASVAVVCYAIFGFYCSPSDGDLYIKTQYGWAFHKNYYEFIASAIFMPPIMLLAPLCVAFVCVHVKKKFFAWGGRG